MKTLATGAILALLSLTARAAVIPIDLGPIQTLSGSSTFTLNQFSGTPLNGQTLSFNILFTGEAGFVRLVPQTDKSFDVGMFFNTTASSWANDATASIWSLDVNGDPNSPRFTTPFPPISGGVPIGLGFGLFPLRSDKTVPLPFEFYGLHIDFTLPDSPGATLQDSSLTFTGNVYAFGPHVPDSGSTLLLFGIGLSAVFCAQVRRSPRRVFDRTDG